MNGSSLLKQIISTSALSLLGMTGAMQLHCNRCHLPALTLPRPAFAASRLWARLYVPMQPPESDNQEGHSTNPQEHEDCIEHNDSSSAFAVGYTLGQNCHPSSGPPPAGVKRQRPASASAVLGADCGIGAMPLGWFSRAELMP